ncbi:hypothetical protein KUCAC02_034226, partial [Chaenocephalus aceratus]
MKVSHTLICFLFLFSLQDGSTGLVSAQLSVYSGIEGEDVRVECSFPSSRDRKDATGVLREHHLRHGLQYKDFEILVVDAKLDGDPSAEKTIDARTGGNIVVECYFTRSVANMYFCKDECKGEDILIETARQYRCGLGRPDSQDPYLRLCSTSLMDFLLLFVHCSDHFYSFIIRLIGLYRNINQSESSLKRTEGRGLVKTQNLMRKHNVLLHQ